MPTNAFFSTINKPWQDIQNKSHYQYLITLSVFLAENKTS